jgi:hypothetical protein
VTGWLVATQARLGMTGEALAALAALDDERAKSGEVGNARAVICLADGDPAGALTALREVLDETDGLLLGCGDRAVTSVRQPQGPARSGIIPEVLLITWRQRPADGGVRHVVPQGSPVR